VQANPEKNREQKRKWVQANLEKHYKSVKKWQQENPEKVRKNNRKWDQANPDKVFEKQQKWKKNNPERYRELHRNGNIKARARRAGAEGFNTAQERIDLKEKYGNKCLCCKIHESEFPVNPRTGRPHSMEYDHVVPLSKGGTNWISNIQPLCHTCNDMAHKGTKIIDYRLSISS
jgi:hypothetical protein